MIPNRFIPERIHWRLFAARLAADPSSWLRLVTSRRQPAGTEIPLRLRPLGGRTISIRAGSADMYTLLDLLPPVHLPPEELGRTGRVWDLGANIGLTAAHIAVLHPEATITGVEMDPANAALARRNLAGFGARCRIIEGAVWVEEGEIRYERGAVDEAAFRIQPESAATDAAAQSVTLNRLAEDLGDDEDVDFVKMDIEGAEERVLRERTEWAQRVRCVRVEVHGPYTVEACFDDLRTLGFEPSGARSVWIEGRGKPVQGIRR